MAGSAAALIASARRGDGYQIVSAVEKRTRMGELDEIEFGSRAGTAHQHAVITRLGRNAVQFRRTPAQQLQYYSKCERHRGNEAPLLVRCRVP
jgi:hypothetical protein